MSGLAPWQATTRGQVLTAVYLLVNQRAESEAPAAYGVAGDTGELLGSLAEFLQRELGGLGNQDPQDVADELETATA